MTMTVEETTIEDVAVGESGRKPPAGEPHDEPSASSRDESHSESHDDSRGDSRARRGWRLRFAPIIDPSVRRPAPKPVRVDLRTVFLVGTGLWTLALVVCLILGALAFDVETARTICASGVVVGVLMLIWEHFDRWDYRRLGQ